VGAERWQSGERAVGARTVRPRRAGDPQGGGTRAMQERPRAGEVAPAIARFAVAVAVAAAAFRRDPPQAARRRPTEPKRERMKETG